jgi:hypothetical protein
MMLISPTIILDASRKLLVTDLIVSQATDKKEQFVINFWRFCQLEPACYLKYDLYGNRSASFNWKTSIPIKKHGITRPLEVVVTMLILISLALNFHFMQINQMHCLNFKLCSIW